MRFILTTLLAAISALGQGRSTPVENDQVRVLKITQDAHKKTGMHKHDMNRVMIYLQPGKQTIAYEDGKKVDLNWKAGQALWSPKSGNHIAEIVSDGTVTIVEIELKKPGSGGNPAASKLDPVKIDKKHNTVEFENDQVRVVRVKIGGKESVPMHEHSLNRVTTYISEEDFQVTGADGKTEHVIHKAGDVTWGTPLKHSAVNLSSKQTEMLVVELK